MSTTAVDDSRTTPRRWAAVAVLSLSTFLVVTSEMLPIGVLTPMAEGLGISTGATGSSLTVTGLVAAVTAPLVPRLLGGLDRRAVLAVAMVVLALGNALTALASGFAFMVLSRVILGLAMGTVWGMAAAVTTRLVAPRDVALAVSFVIGGVAAASVAGVPLGTMVGDALGWRAAFTALAIAALVLAAALTVALPRLPRPAASAGDDGPAQALLTPAVAIGLAMVALLVTAHFAAYTYVRPVLEEHSGLAPTAIAPLLLVYGLFGLAGNFLAGATAARRSRLTILTLAGGIALAVALSALSGQTSWVAWVWIALWGAAYGGVSVAGQLWMTRAVPHRVEQIAGLYVGVFTASIALGALLGGVVVEAAGLVLLLWSAAALALVSLLVGVFGPRR
ncbi:major Facilitator Superfamily protein [Nocardiopsis alba ATCC BAA-2165]|uniref:Major Facilitator Superfamily protein n=1 Tax=Nocardiopsis alba (strain ATCC BAA-2165 / BE74) TaxID=1205910 RepID=J7LBB1_NOCAA|nr:major Facilitator Superfamily protein [Nocardiopsis alba ATCC BAA-2165]